MTKFLSPLGMLVLSLTLTAATTGCSKSGPKAPRTNAFEGKVTQANYINGRQFCARYSNINGREFGKYVTVPKDYNQPNGAKLQIYVFSKREFNPALETYVYLDGGPGQNTHGAPATLRGEVNELQFDQRGLGCSAPNSFREYSDFSQYSTENTVRDLEEIRKAYGISKITVYGVSYGTVPATRYGSMFKSSTKSVVIEGVVGTPALIHDPNWKAEKLNLMLQRLNTVQQNTFADIMLNERKKAELMFGYIHGALYQDEGFDEMLRVLNLLIDTSGRASDEMFQKLKAHVERRDTRFPTVQQPFGVDLNILETIYCKELNARHKRLELDFERYRNFFVRQATSREADEANEECDAVGVKPENETPYRIADNKVDSPVYYFQGSHDGATHAIGAIEHWKVVPQGKAYFMLAKRGGHNPMGERLDSATTKSAQQDLMLKAVNGAELTQADVNPVNIQKTSATAWVLFIGRYTTEILSHLSGI